MENKDENDESRSDWAKRLPKANYFEKAIELAASFDRLLVSLYSALIAGIVVLLLHEEVSLWVGGPLFVALVLFVLGIGHTLVHMGFMSKLLLLAEALVNGTEVIPNPVEQDERTLEVYARNQAYAQRSCSSQLIYLLLGMGFGAVAMVIRFWEYAWRGGVVVLIVAVAAVIVVALIITWRKTLRRFPPALVTRKARD